MRSGEVVQSLPLKTAALPGTTALYATTKEKNRQAKLSKLTEMAHLSQSGTFFSYIYESYLPVFGCHSMHDIQKLKSY